MLKRDQYEVPTSALDQKSIIQDLSTGICQLWSANLHTPQANLHLKFPHQQSMHRKSPPAAIFFFEFAVVSETQERGSAGRRY